MNPYVLRKKGLSQPLSLQELGRILYQITGHRGFPTKYRQGTLSESAIKTGMPAAERLGILHTQKQLANSTLGVYLEGLLPEEEVSYKHQEERIRNSSFSAAICIGKLYKIVIAKHSLNKYSVVV